MGSCASKEAGVQPAGGESLTASEGATVRQKQVALQQCQSVRYAKNKVVPVDETSLVEAPADKRQRISLTSSDSAIKRSDALELSPTPTLELSPMQAFLPALHVLPSERASLAAPLPPIIFGRSDGYVQQLLDACHCKPSNFESFSKGLQALSRNTAAFFQRQAAAPLPAAVVASTVAAAAACLTSALEPVLAGTDRALSNPVAGISRQVRGPTWEDVDLAYLIDALEGASSAAFGVDLVTLGAALLPLLDALLALQQHIANHAVALRAVPAGIFMVPAASQLIAMLGVVFFRKVVLEDAVSLQGKLEGFQQLRSRLGWQDQHLATVLDGPAKALLVHLKQAASTGERKLAFTIRRSRAYWDAFSEASQQNLLQGVASNVCYRVFPAFVEELQGGPDGPPTSGSPRNPHAPPARVEAGEGHGPRKEFFSLAGLDMTGQAEPGPGAPRAKVLFVHNRSAGAFWYNTELVHTPELQASYQFAGWLMGQSLLNKAPLAIRWPAAVFAAAMEGPSYSPGLSDLEEFDPSTAASLRNVLSLPRAQLRDMMVLEGLPARTTAEQYINNAVQALLVEAAQWQAAALRVGLWRALDEQALAAWAMSPAQLSDVLAAGTGAEDEQFEVQKVFRVVADEELSGRSKSLMTLLWSVLAAWPVPQRRRFLAFVTGSDRLPVTGSELLRIETPFVPLGAKEHAAMLGHLPQAHTCDNLLELPNYWESLGVVRGVPDPASLGPQQLADFTAEVRRILDDRLALAVTNFEGYGLDQRDVGGAQQRGPVSNED